MTDPKFNIIYSVFYVNSLVYAFTKLSKIFNELSFEVFNK